MNINKIKTGRHLRKFREGLGLPQEKFAHIIGYSLNRISTIELQKLPVSKKIREAISIKLEELQTERV